MCASGTRSIKPGPAFRENLPILCQPSHKRPKGSVTGDVFARVHLCEHSFVFFPKPASAFILLATRFPLLNLDLKPFEVLFVELVDFFAPSHSLLLETPCSTGGRISSRPSFAPRVSPSTVAHQASPSPSHSRTPCTTCYPSVSHCIRASITLESSLCVSLAPSESGVCSPR